MRLRRRLSPAFSLACALALLAVLALAGSGVSGASGADDASPPTGRTTVDLASGVSSVPGLAMAWGGDGSGQLGSTACSPCVAPVTVGAGEGMSQTVVSVDAGGPIRIGVNFQDAGHSLAALSDGTIWAWGDDRNSQLGNGGANENEVAPVQVPGVSNAVAVAAGGQHSMALLSNGTVMTWGSDVFGQAGDGGATGGNILPTVVPGLTGVTAISAGANHSLALLSNGTVMAWGRDDSGQLGDNTTLSNRSAPTAVSGLTNAIAISAGRQHSLATLADGTVRAWGLNLRGQLGNGETNNEPVPVAVEGLSAVISVAAGSEHSLALRSDRTVRAWGRDGNGQLGNGLPLANELLPVTVSGLSGVRAIDAGGSFSLAIDFNGRVRSWGRDSSGMLGNSTPGQDASVPTTVTGPLGTGGATVVAAGQVHALAIVALCEGERVTRVGTLGNDTMIGSSGNDVIHGLAGVDRLRGSGGNDTICGGEGDDLIQGGTGDNDLFGNSGFDTAEFPEGAVNANLLPGQRIATQGADQDTLNAIENLEGSEQADTLTGGTTGNRIDGNGGDDEISGVFGNDTLNGGSGNDDISGGPGDDIMNGNSGVDDLIGGQDTDTVSYSGETAKLIISLPGDVVTFPAPSPSEDLIEVENVTGGSNDDLIFGDSGPNILKGGDGVDVIGGLEGDDEVFGDDGDDSLSGGLNSDLVDGGEGNDTVIYGEEAVVVRLDFNPNFGATASGFDDLFNIENATGSPFADNLFGNSEANVLEGSGDLDTLVGGGGADTLNGGPGADTIYPGEGAASIDGGEGRDELSYALSSNAVDANLNLERTLAADGNDVVEGIEDLEGSELGDTLVGDDNDNELEGLDGPDFIVGNGGADRLIGNAHNDDLDGSEGSDELVGGTEDDRLTGGDDPDILDGGAGSDTAVFTGAQNVVSLATGANNQGDTIVSNADSQIENLTGSSGADTLTGDAGPNVLNGFKGDDTLRGGGGADTYVGDIGSDTVNYTGPDAVTVDLSNGSNNQGDTFSGIENIVGSAGVDSLTGNDEANRLEGRASGDVLIGGGADDELIGAGGPDTLDGGPGANDTCNGGPGVDTFDPSCEVQQGVP
ncbi:MAG: hypothetical protein WEB00_09430 [Dehalococcoidia bacterium]